MTTSYLAAIDAAPDAQKFPLARKFMMEEPLPFFAELREKRPVLVTPDATLVARYADVVDVLSIPLIMTVQPYVPKMQNGLYLMAHDDDALHTREKSIMQSMLNRDDLPRVRAMVGSIAADLLSAAGGRIDAVPGYTRLVPARLVQDYFGLVGIDTSKLIEWSFWNQYDTFHNQPFDLLPAQQSADITKHREDAGTELSHYLIELIATQLLAVKAEEAGSLVFSCVTLVKLLINWLRGKRYKAPKDTIVKRMLRTSYPDQVDFDIERLGINASGLLIGAIETTSQAVAQAIAYLLERPPLLQQAIQAAQAASTATFDGIVWETLRFVPISPYMFRRAASPYTVAKGTKWETTVAPGTYVLPLSQSAMFDDTAFDQPERFNPDRNWYHYFTFGFGSHECLGKYVGMVMIPEMVRQILLKPGIAAAGKIDYRSGPFPESYPLTWKS